MEEEPAAEEEDAGETQPEAEPEELEGPWAGVVASMGEARDALVTTAHRRSCARDAAVAYLTLRVEQRRCWRTTTRGGREVYPGHGTRGGLVNSRLSVHAPRCTFFFPTPARPPSGAALHWSAPRRQVSAPQANVAAQLSQHCACVVTVIVATAAIDVAGRKHQRRAQQCQCGLPN